MENIVIVVVLYTNDMMFFANTYEVAQKFLRALEEICMNTKLIMNSLKTKIMFVMSQNKNKPTIHYV